MRVMDAPPGNTRKVEIRSVPRVLWDQVRVFVATARDGSLTMSGFVVQAITEKLERERRA